MRFENLAELVDAAPIELGATSWLVVTQDDVSAFGRATRAEEWIHVDPERARSGPFGTTVVHGFLTLSLATYFQTQLLQVPGEIVGVNYGISYARFPAALPVGSRVRATGRLTTAERTEGGAKIEVRLTYECAGLDKPPCVVDVVSLLLNERVLGAPLSAPET